MAEANRIANILELAAQDLAERQQERQTKAIQAKRLREKVRYHSKKKKTSTPTMFSIFGSSKKKKKDDDAGDAPMTPAQQKDTVERLARTVDALASARLDRRQQERERERERNLEAEVDAEYEQENQEIDTLHDKYRASAERSRAEFKERLMNKLLADREKFESKMEADHQLRLSSKKAVRDKTQTAKKAARDAQLKKEDRAWKADDAILTLAEQLLGRLAVSPNAAPVSTPAAALANQFEDQLDGANDNNVEPMETANENQDDEDNGQANDDGGDDDDSGVEETPRKTGGSGQDLDDDDDADDVYQTPDSRRRSSTTPADVLSPNSIKNFLTLETVRSSSWEDLEKYVRQAVAHDMVSASRARGKVIFTKGVLLAILIKMLEYKDEANSLKSRSTADYTNQELVDMVLDVFEHLEPEANENE